MVHRSRTTALAPIIASLVVLTGATNTDGVGEVKDVYFHLIVSSAPTANTSGVVSVVDRTLELINGDAEVVLGYRLHYSRVLDTQVSTVRITEVKVNYISAYIASWCCESL